ncbi:unnamed protein product [Rotaria socialis]|uniref:Uncharacterized protein n=1 Tax=Rotaria socialis TaxID=392032 RepID=A0A817VT18_9BILA|nr:unnamed protein product [Rotaria socialis]CAF4691737.1 unnamed protein product [Rotaria socialis]
MIGIALTPDDKSPLSSAQTLRVTTLLSVIGVTKEMQNSLYYFCTTDRCNDISVFKRMLGSLSIINKLNDLDCLLKPDELFDGLGCLLLHTNNIDDMCKATSAFDPTTYTTQAPIDKICATCFKDDVGGNYLGEESVFNMNDQTLTPSWFIHCQSKNCNDLSTV